MTVRYRGHHCTQLRLGVVSPVGRDGRLPTLRVGTENRERERRHYCLRLYTRAAAISTPPSTAAQLGITE